MVINFKKEYLKELYETGKCSNKKYRYQPNVIKRYAKCIFTLQEAQKIEDLYRYNSLSYKLLSGDKSGISSIRVNDQYRIEFIVNEIEGIDEIIITVCNILELSNHYK